MTRFIFTENPPEQPEGHCVLYESDALEALQRISTGLVRCWVTSPPYFNKIDYGIAGQVGLEDSVEDYLDYQRRVAREMLRCSTPDANLFWIIQDTSNGSGGTGGDYRREDGSYRIKMIRGPNLKSWPRKAQLLIPELTRIAIVESGWIPVLRIIWDKNDPRRAAIDRPSYSYEEVLVFSASPDHYWNRERVLTPFADESLSQLAGDYNGEAQHDYAAEGTEDPSDTKRRIIESMRKRSGALLRAIWHIPSGNQPVVEVNGKLIKGVACFPSLLAEICVNLGSDYGDIVGDPYAGLGTTLLSALKWGRNALGIELHPLYSEVIRQRLKKETIK